MFDASNGEVIKATEEALIAIRKLCKEMPDLPKWEKIDSDMWTFNNGFLIYRITPTLPYGYFKLEIKSTNESDDQFKSILKSHSLEALFRKGLKID